MRLENKTVLVTGGSKGIGKAIVERFRKEGAHIIVFGIKKPDYEVNFYQVDISNKEQIKKAFDKIDKLDILVNNAGIYFQETVEATKKEQLDRILDVNLKGTYLMCKYALPLIKKSKGSIINISSTLGMVPEPESPAYCASKAAIIMLTKCMAQEYGPLGIRINSIAPGPIDTPLLRASFKSGEDAKECAEKNPMKRIGKPEEVANVALFLASDEASYVNGATYTVDGGESSSSVYSK